MAKYANLLFSAEEYYKIGPFRFPVYNDMTPGEVKAINAIEKTLSQSRLDSMELARKIAKENNMSNKEALDILANASDPNNEDIIYSYLPELTKINEAAEDDIDTLVKYCTVLMIHRGEVKLPNETEYQQTRDWTEEDTERVHRSVLQKMRQFIFWERDGWPAKEADLEEPVGNEPVTTIPKVKRST